MEDVSEGKVSKEDAKKSIMDYLDIRKNKVRDHQYGRERFDGFMKGLQTLMEPQEFADYCKGVDDARRARDPSYKGVTNPEDYMSPEARQKLAQEREQQAAEREAQEAKLDEERLAKDAQEPGRAEKNQKFLGWLGKQQNMTQKDRANAEQYMTDHPGVREEARKIAEKRGLDVDIPQSRRQPEKQQPEKQEPVKEQPKGPEAGG